MALSNFWWLLLWLFIIGGIGEVISLKRKEMVCGRIVERWKWLSAILLAAPYVVWAAWRSNVFGDTGQYRITFKEMPTGLSNMGAYIATRSKGKGFAIFEYIFKSVISQSDIAFFFLVAAIQLLCIVYVYRKYSINFWMSMFLFIASTDYMLWMHNGMRQFIAVSIIFLSCPLIAEKKYKTVCLAVLAASFFHSSALVFLPFIFIVNGRAWNRRTVIFLIGIVLAVIFVDRVTGFMSDAMRNTEYEGDIEYLEQDEGANIIRVLFYSVPALMALIFRSYIDTANDSLINVCVNLSIIAAGFYVFSIFSSGILMGSIPIYFSLANYILIPWMISEVFNSSSAKLVNVLFIGVYCFFYYYQMGPTWKLL